MMSAILHFSSLRNKHFPFFNAICSTNSPTILNSAPQFARNLMDDSNNFSSGVHSNCSHQNGGEVENVGPDYAEIVIIRHGETEWNSDGRTQGHLDVELNDVGRQQAYAVADRLSRDPKISAVYSSDLTRASETAEIIAKTCGLLEITKDSNLRKRHLGDLQGLILKEAPQYALSQAFYPTQRINHFQGASSYSISRGYYKSTSQKGFFTTWREDGEGSEYIRECISHV